MFVCLISTLISTEEDDTGSGFALFCVAEGGVRKA
jgi:hypothetical protein